MGPFLDPQVTETLTPLKNFLSFCHLSEDWYMLIRSRTSLQPITSNALPRRLPGLYLRRPRCVSYERSENDVRHLHGGGSCINVNYDPVKHRADTPAFLLPSCMIERHATCEVSLKKSSPGLQATRQSPCLAIDVE